MYSRSPWASEPSSRSRSECGRFFITTIDSPKTVSSTTSNGPPGPVSCSSISRMRGGRSLGSGSENAERGSLLPMGVTPFRRPARAPSAVMRSRISCAHASNSGRSPPAGSTTSSQSSSSALASPRAATRAASASSPGASSRARRRSVAVLAAASGWVRRTYSTCSRARHTTRSASSTWLSRSCRLRWPGAETSRPARASRVRQLIGIPSTTCVPAVVIATCSTAASSTCAARIAPAITDRAALPVQTNTMCGAMRPRTLPSPG